MSVEEIASALQKDDLEEAKALIKSSFEGPQKLDINQLDEGESTLLCLAVAFGHEEIVKLLVEYGADVSATSFCVGPGGAHIWLPALHIGVMEHIEESKKQKDSSHKRILQFLIQSGADVDQKDSQGKTAADRAIECGDPKIAEDLKSMKLAKKEKEVLTQISLGVGLNKSAEPKRRL